MRDVKNEEASLPPNQQLAASLKWPVMGEKSPRNSTEPWLVSIGGLVATPMSWSLEEITAMPRVEQIVDIHCVTRWSKTGARFSGVPLSRLLERCRPLPEARFLSFKARSEVDHSTSLLLDEALRVRALVALEYEGKSLDDPHGGPVRMVVPEKYFYKSVKWLERIDVLAEDRLGRWEREAGYHNQADPWLEQRYIVPSLDKRTIRDALAKRDFIDKDFHSLDATGLDLAGLKARGALLRATNFRRVNLEHACFDSANLSNAHLEGSNLRGATFLNADVEGANFCGADLRGTDFTGASLFGSTFFAEESGPNSFGPSRIDRTTRIDEAGIEALTPTQQMFVRQALDEKRL
ncbi:MAG TPA: molybdopterin-dependent oxidoreductase [Pyrinomonadaceae bacterium]|nr:molybdopterin-dependent oxidoreductase [Pyrinomonadaceae bacterium]